MLSKLSACIKNLIIAQCHIMVKMQQAEIHCLRAYCNFAQCTCARYPPTLSLLHIQDVESYIHRSGGTCRAGQTGASMLFYKSQQEYMIPLVERKAGVQFQGIGAPQGKFRQSCLLLLHCTCIVCTYILCNRKSMSSKHFGRNHPLPLPHNLCVIVYIAANIF